MEDFSAQSDVGLLRSRIQEISAKEKEDIQKVQDEIKDRINHIKSEAKAALDVLSKELLLKEQEFYTSKSFEGYENTEIKDLDELSLSQLIFLVYKIFGTHQRTSSYWRGSNVLSRQYIYGDVSYGVLGDSEFQNKLRSWLQKHSCTYCKSIIHAKSECPKLAAKHCSVCHKQGHTADKCNDIDALRRRYKRRY